MNIVVHELKLWQRKLYSFIFRKHPLYFIYNVNPDKLTFNWSDSGSLKSIIIEMGDCNVKQQKNN